MAKAGVVYVDVRADTSGFVGDINRAASRAVGRKVRVDADTTPFSSSVSKASAKANTDLAGITTTKAQAQVKKLGDTFENELGHQSGVLSNLSGSLVGIGAGAAFVGARIVSSLRPAVNEASALNETMSFAGVVFGDQLPQIERFGDGAAKALGLSKREAIDGATSFAGYAEQAGLAGDEVVSFSEKLVGLAADIGSAKGLPTAEGINAITGTFRGEFDTIEKFGVILTAASVAAEAVRLNLAESTSAVSATAKILATESLLWQQTTKAQGDFARTADSAANSAKTLASNMTNAKAAAGSGLLGLLSGVNKAASELTQTIGPGLTSALGVGIFGVGAASFLGGATTSIVGAGQALKRMRGDATEVVDDLGDLGSAGCVAGDDLEMMGRKGSRGIGLLKAAGIALVAAAVTEAGFSIINNARDIDARLEDSINATVAATQEGGAAVVESFNEIARTTANTAGISQWWKRVGAEFKLGGQGAVRDIEFFEEAFDKLFAADPAAAQALVDQIRLLNAGLDENSADFKESEKLIAIWQGRLDNARGAQEAQTGATKDGADAVGQLGSEFDTAAGKITRFGIELDANASKWDQYGQIIGGIFDPIDEALSANDALADGQQRVIDARDKLTAAESGSSEGLVSARRALVDADRELTKAMEENAKNIEDADRRVRDAQRSLEEALEAGAAQASGGVEGEGSPRVDLSVARGIASARDDLAEAQREAAEARRGEGIAQAKERIAEAQRKVNEEQAKVGPNGEAALQATEDYEEAQRAIPGLIIAAEQANARLRAEYEQNPDAIQQSIAKIDEWTARGLISVDTARRWKEELLGALAAGQALADLPGGPLAPGTPAPGFLPPGSTATNHPMGPFHSTPPLTGAGPTQPGQGRVLPPPLAGSGPTQAGQQRAGSAPTVADFLNSFPRNPRVGDQATVGGVLFVWNGATWVKNGVPFGDFFGAGRALGGPVYGNTLHPVNEQRVPELYTDRGGSQYLMPTAQGGQVTPLDGATGGSGNADILAALEKQNALLVRLADGRANVQIDQLITTYADKQSGYQESLRAAEDATYSVVR